MTELGFDAVLSEIQAIHTTNYIGRVAEIGRGLIKVSGLSKFAAIGDSVELRSEIAGTTIGEVTQLATDYIYVMPDGIPAGLQVDDPVELIGPYTVSPHDSWIGRVIDPYCNPIDGRKLLRGPESQPLQGEVINPAERRPLGPRLETGQKIFNTLLPIVRGQRIGIFAGSGVGKSTLLAKLAMGIDADIVVIAMIGERGREVRYFIDRVLGPEGMKRAIVVVSTSNDPPLSRRRGGWTAAAIAEYFRDQGKHVLLIVDSITRFAEAHRDIAFSNDEEATLKGYPSTVVQLLNQLCERCGPGSDETGDITAIFNVLVAGSDMDEPIADIMRGVLDGHVVLDRKIAERGRFPAIDILRSVSRALPDAASEPENQLLKETRLLLGAYERSETLIRAGLYSEGVDRDVDRAIEFLPVFENFITKHEPKSSSQSFEDLQSCLPKKKDLPATPEIEPNA